MSDQLASLAGMTSEQIVEARKAGRLDDMLGIGTPDEVRRMRAGETVTPTEARDAARAGYYNEVAAAQQSGRINWEAQTKP